MGYISPISFSHYSQYQERVNQPKKVFVPRIDSLKKISKYEASYRSFTDKKMNIWKKQRKQKQTLHVNRPQANLSIKGCRRAFLGATVRGL